MKTKFILSVAMNTEKMRCIQIELQIELQSKSINKFHIPGTDQQRVLVLRQQLKVIRHVAIEYWHFCICIRPTATKGRQTGTESNRTAQTNRPTYENTRGGLDGNAHKYITPV